MSRFGLLLAVLSALLACCSGEDAANATSARSAAGLLGAGYKSAGWRRVTAAADWEGRAGGVVEWYSGPVNTGGARPVTGNWLLLYGAGAWSCYNDCPAKREVWASANKGVKWTQIQPASEFNPLMSAQTVQDHKGVQYRIQGTDEGHGCNNGEQYSDVWTSSDGGYRWIQKPDFPAPGTRFLGTAVVDSANVIYVMHGQDCNDPLNDVWKSTNGGNTWSQVAQRGTRNPPGRAVHGSVVGKYYDSVSKQSVDAIYIMFGWRGSNAQGNLYRNDVWVSTNGASTWTQLTEKASFSARGDSQLEITSKGVLVIAGGVSEIAGTERRQLNDVWASLDGGYTWGVCSENAKWDDRIYPYTAFDSDGYLYIMGGTATDPDGITQLVNDVWVSTQSFDDPAAVADICGLIVPPCGVGLRCMPNDNLVQGSWGVSCDACPWTPLASNSAPAASMTMTYLFVAFLLATIALAAILGYIVYRAKQSGASSPIPLPGSAQRWWNDKPTGGLSEEINKGNTASDTMYNPLTIRDQM